MKKLTGIRGGITVSLSSYEIVMTNDQHFDAKDDSESKRDFLIKQNRLYVVSPYYADSDGKLIPELPDLGPCHNWDQRPCHLGIDHYRDLLCRQNADR